MYGHGIFTQPLYDFFIVINQIICVIGEISKYKCLVSKACEDLLPNISDLCWSHLLVLHLNHCKATHGIQEAPGAHQVDGAPLLGELCEGLPPADR